MWLLMLLAAILYAGIITIRQGPPSSGDTVPLTTVTSDLSSGALQAAASNTALPNPPGYALLTSPFVAAFRSSVGSPVWCTTSGRAIALRSDPHYRHDPSFATDVGECGSPHRMADGHLGPPLPPWYRSQGVLGVIAWLILALGCLGLLRAAGCKMIGRQAALLIFLAFLPAASSAIVQLFHPQDIVSLGLAAGGLALTFRRRFVLAGVLFGAAFLTKQFAILMLIPALVAVPETRSRFHLLISAAAIFSLGILPFLIVNPAATLDNVSGFSVGGATGGSTVLSLLGVTGNLASAIARDAPVAFALAACLWARRRLGDLVSRPETYVGLTLACVASRLVFESVIFPYYLLAGSVVFFMLDLVAGRLPHRSLAWCAATAFFVALKPGSHVIDAFGTLVFAVLAVAMGICEVSASGAIRKSTVITA